MELLNFLQFLSEDRQIRKAIEAGDKEFKDTDYYFALEYLKRNGFDVLATIPNFEKNFNKVKKAFSKGSTLRKDMPRLGREDCLELQDRLKKGKIDIRKPFSKNTNIENPFPEGLKGQEAEDFLMRGLDDGYLKDDIIKVIKTDLVVEKLIPIQKQVYFDQVADFFFNYKSILSIQKQVTDRFFLVSSDNRILDGHHRFGISFLIDPKMLVPCIQVDLKFSELLPLSKSFGDAIGNERNK